jgi:hypothetical protein
VKVFCNRDALHRIRSDVSADVWESSILTVGSMQTAAVMLLLDRMILTVGGACASLS